MVKILTDKQLRDLCLELMHIDSEIDVIGALQRVGLWDDPDAWHPFDDNPNNFSTIGNQQSRPEAALVEKLVNAVDARLTNAALEQRIDPEGPAAPRSIREAVACLFEGRDPPFGPDAGRVHHWESVRRTAEGRQITLAATGFKPEGDRFPCFSIADSGEGQSPGAFPSTFLSLHRSNKLKIPFVQGKFNMGGTGALRFCGRHNLQLIVSRRNPRLVEPGTSERDKSWGFTIVRREDPAGGVRSSVYTYLVLPGDNGIGVPSFTADTMPLFPEATNAYARPTEWGTLVKLYEYRARGFRSNIITSGQGLLRRMDLLLPELALPIRLYECRPYRGHKGSFETNITGVAVRLSDDRAANMEEGFPSSANLTVLGQKMKVRLYAFKKGKAEDYRMRQGVLFTINGQAHGDLAVDFFRRKSAGMSYLADSLFVTVDCSELDGRAREDLFMNSRDRLAAGPLKDGIESELAELLRHHETLRELKNRRRESEIAERLEDSKPLEDVLKSLIERSPTLASLFLLGKKLPNPFTPQSVRNDSEPYAGKRFPTYFHFKGKSYGDVLDRDAHLERRVRILFETDARNDYLDREVEPGTASLDVTSEQGRVPAATFTLNLHDGIGALTMPLPESAEVGDFLTLRLEVTDETRLDSFVNEFRIRIKPKSVTPTKTDSKRNKPPSKNQGDDRDAPIHLALPEIVKVHESDWKEHGFDRFSALEIKHAGTSNDHDEVASDSFDFFVNVDNIYVRTEQKRSKEPAELMEQRFMHGLVLVGLAMIQDDMSTRPDEDAEDNEESGRASVERKVAQVTRALAPVLLPMIDALGSVEDLV